MLITGYSLTGSQQFVFYTLLHFLRELPPALPNQRRYIPRLSQSSLLAIFNFFIIII